MNKSYSNLRHLLFVCAVFLLSSFYSFLAFSQCNPAANDVSFNPLDNVINQGTAAVGENIVITPTNKIIVSAFGYILKYNQNGSIDNTFVFNNQRIFSNVRVSDMKLEPTQKIIAVGTFQSAVLPNKYILRLNENGEEDITNPISTPYFTNYTSITAVYVLPDGKMLVAGDLRINNIGASLIRILPNGDIDNTFNSVKLDQQIPYGSTLTNDIEVQADGKIIVVGFFNRMNSSSITSKNIIRLNSDGTLDTAFNVGGIGTDQTVNAVKLLPNGRILVGGFFSSYNGATNHQLVKLNSDGSIDTNFTSSLTPNTGTINNASYSVKNINIQVDGKILLEGYISPTTSATEYVNARLHTNGDFDLGIEIERNLLYSIKSAIVEFDGGFLTGFRRINEGLSKFNNDGTRDLDFRESYGFNGGINQKTVADDGSIFVLGAFNKYNNLDTKQIAKLTPDGNLDTSYNPLNMFNGIATYIKAVGNGKLLAAGQIPFSSDLQLIRFNQDASVDNTFNAASIFLPNVIGSKVNDIAIQSDGKIIVVGRFTTASSESIIRLNADGSRDNSFISTGINVSPSSNTGVEISAVEIQQDGKIVIAGRFYSVNGVSSQKSVARLNPDGSLDISFVSNVHFNQYTLVTALKIQEDNKILVAGYFQDGYNTPSSDIRGIIRTNEDGSRDSTFTIPTVDMWVYDLAIQTDGKILLGGIFENVAGTPSKNIARVNANGTVDTSFDIGIGITSSNNSARVKGIVLNNEYVYVMGSFQQYNGINRSSIVRLKNNGTSISNITPSTEQYGLCTNTQTTLKVQGTGTQYWYDSPTTTAPFHTGSSYTTPLLIADSTYFYVQDSVVGCGSSSRMELLVTTSQILNATSKTNYILYLDNTGTAEINAVLLDSASSAGCGNTIISYLFDDTSLTTRSFSCADTNAVNNVILRVTDNNGNTETSPSIIHVKDTIRPVFTTRILPVFFNASNQATISASHFLTSLSDNCTDSAAINVVFHDTGLPTRNFNCGYSAIQNYRIRVTDAAGNQVIRSVFINPLATNYDFNVNIISSSFRPALNTMITVVANNYSCAAKSGELKVTLPSTVEYVSASIAPNRIVGNDLFWDVTDLNYNREFVSRIFVRSLLTLNIGDEVCFTGYITPVSTDFYRANNQKGYCFPVVNSYDPNDKQVYPQGICDDKFTKRSDLPLTYTIRFQNTGNAPALNVRIADSLSSLLNRRSLRVVGSSHPMVVDTTANNNVINFKFDNINLPDSASSPELSQGYVIFELDEIAAHTDTSRIENKSYIYFDTNAPIITNTVKNTIVNTLPLCNPAGGSNPPLAACTLPTNLRTEILSSTKVKLLWTTPTNTNAVTYEVLRNGQRLITIPASNLFYIDSTLTANTQYNYSIKAICGNNNATSNSVQVRTLPATPVLLSIVAACKGEKGKINVQSAGATYRVYSSNTSTTPLFETNNASIETPVLNDSTTFYISVVINGQESQRLKAIVPIKEVFEATIEQGALFESCATQFVLSAQEVEGATYTWFRETVQVGTERTLTTTFAARYKVRVVKNGCFDDSEFTTTRFVTAPTAKIQQGTSVSFCGNGTLNAQDTSSNVVYEWILNGNVIKTGTSVSVSESGTYTLKASQPSCSDSTTIAVTITTAPTNVALTASKTEICTGSETTLSATTGTGFTYKWFRNNTAISTTSATLSTSEIGKYKVEVTTQDGCKVTTNEVEITQKQATNATITVNKVEGKDETITVSSSDSIVSVVWFKEGNEISVFANQKTVTPTETGKYKAIVTYSTGCKSETEEKVFTFDTTVGIEEESAKIFTIYPNPNTGSFKVEFATTTNQKTKLTLVDGLGRIIHSQEITMNQKTTSITLPKISAGVYVIQIISEGKVYTKQLVIQ